MCSRMMFCTILRIFACLVVAVLCGEILCAIKGGRATRGIANWLGAALLFVWGLIVAAMLVCAVLECGG